MKIEKEICNYDVAIIGAGPAGLSAALYAARANKTVILFDKDMPGGQLNHATHIENYPGFNKADCLNSGADLVNEMVDQLHPYEDKITMKWFTPVTHIEIPQTADPIYRFSIMTDTEYYRARGLIIATGLTHRYLFEDHAMEDALVEKGGISHCVLCDGVFNKGKLSAIIGDGNSALQAFITLAEINKTSHEGGVTLISNARDFPPYVDKTLVAKVKQIMADPEYKCRTNVLFNFTTFKVGQVDNGAGCINYITGYTCQDAMADCLYFTGQIFIMVGQEPTDIVTKVFPDLATFTPSGYINAGVDCRVSGINYVYAVGDCRDGRSRIRQAITASAEGATAATYLCSALDAEGN